ncbi:SMI1/KNR4 family protein [Caenimonas aquaedulcis]|uniref:SMI1/KNR4 family protein n=1 Tax=Caenimonas aquaedulcis TaxID=2793270 RepID=A0A931MFK7_9BURK|nr:SMI1/KNR4 family protein [Caenimonas aquaedulcis]MBG9387421.1 SMI1/KNR4 family protein [Caenimonas aquaedulcis]
MNELWNRFENWLSVHWPDVLPDLNPPATNEEIAQLEEALGVTLPSSFVECLKIHNGHSTAEGLFDGFEFLSTAEILDQWSIWKDLVDAGDFEGAESEPHDGVRGDWWNVRWIPITHNGGGDHMCIDLDPDEGGKAGQIISMWHDMADRELLAASFEDWFRNYVAAVLAGEYVVEDGALVRED